MYVLILLFIIKFKNNKQLKENYLQNRFEVIIINE